MSSGDVPDGTSLEVALRKQLQAIFPSDQEDHDQGTLKRLESRTRPVYAYWFNGRSYAVKLYGLDPVPFNERQRRLEKELKALNTLRGSGLDHPPLSVVRPLGLLPAPFLGLIEDLVPGLPLLKILQAGSSPDLEQAVSLVARVLSAVHSSEPPDEHGWWVPAWEKRMASAPSSLKREETADALRAWSSLFPLPLPVVPLHGDANPTNFLLNADGLTAIDLEMFHYGYPVEDLGQVAAELKFAFFQREGTSSGAEPLIKLLFQSYSQVSGIAFDRLTAFNPLYMGLWELAMASNAWLGQAKRSWLVWQAYNCLTSGLQLALSYIKRDRGRASPSGLAQTGPRSSSAKLHPSPQTSWQAQAPC